jgi:hypothetical protein
MKCYFLIFLMTNALNAITVGFLVQQLSFRGTEVAIYDYAHFNETILGNISVIINKDIYTRNEVRDRFEGRFHDRFYDCGSWEEMDEALRAAHVDILYVIKPCTVHPRYPDGTITHVCKTVAHLVFPWPSQAKFDCYAHISDWMAQNHKGYGSNVVPHMVYLPDEKKDMRTELGIPADATVFGRYGGWDTFDVSFVQDVVKEIAQEDPTRYFIFLNTPHFCSLPNVIFLEKTTDLNKKTQFINTCDALLHARSLGETFGLTCAEFSIRNKPVITWTDSPQKAHIQFLGPKGIYYKTADDLKGILRTFKPDPYKNWDMFSKRFSPEPVMQQFEALFINRLMNKDM